MEDFFLKALPPFLVSFGVVATLAYFSGKAKQVPENRQLGYGPELKVLGWIGIVLAFALLVTMFAVDHGSQYVPIAGIAAFFGLLGAWLLMEGYRTVGFYDEQQITMSSVWGSTRTGKWADLRQAAFKKNGQYFELTFVDGTRIGMSKMLRGHAAVCDHVESLGVVVKDRPD